MLTGIGAPTAWPFLNRSPQPSGVTHLALGTVTGLPAPSLTIGGVTVLAGELLVVGVGYTVSVGLPPVIDINGHVMVIDVSRDSTAAVLRSMIYSLVAPVSIVAGTITATWPAPFIYIAGIVASRFTGINGIPEEVTSRVFLNTANPFAGPTLDYGSPRVAYGLVVTNGLVGDALGVWQPTNGLAEMHAGQRATINAIDVKEGWNIMGGIPGGALTSIHGQTSRRTNALAVYYD